MDSLELRRRWGLIILFGFYCIEVNIEFGVGGSKVVVLGR